MLCPNCCLIVSHCSVWPKSLSLLCSDRFRHQERYFSDGTPPPIPKKRLARTLSLPGNSAPPVSPLSPVSPLLRHPQNFDNPVYMLAPIPNTCFSEETEAVEPASRSSISLQPFSQLSFDTPDEHLPYLFSGFDDQRVVSQGIQHRHLLFLRSMAQSVEAKILLQRETSEREVSPYQPQDFLLYGGSEPKLIGDTVYYSVHSPKFPGRVLGLKVMPQLFSILHLYYNMLYTLSCMFFGRALLLLLQICCTF